MSMMHARTSDVALVVLMCSFFSGYPLRSGTSEEVDDTQICADTAQIAKGVEEQWMNGDTFTGHGAKEVVCGNLEKKAKCSKCGPDGVWGRYLQEPWCVGDGSGDCVWKAHWTGLPKVDSRGECNKKAVKPRVTVPQHDLDGIFLPLPENADGDEEDEFFDAVEGVVCGNGNTQPDCSQCGNSQESCQGDDTGDCEWKGNCLPKVLWMHKPQFLQYEGLWELLTSKESPKDNRSFSWQGPKMKWMEDEDNEPDPFKNQLIYEFNTLPWTAAGACRLELKLYKMRTTAREAQRSDAVSFSFKLKETESKLVFEMDSAVWEYNHKKWFSKNTTDRTEKEKGVSLLFEKLPRGDIGVTLKVGPDIEDIVDLYNIPGFAPKSGRIWKNPK
mmetsp:Transcript_131267/g.226869  ORF Transcript_131267/g.226869 Transcript_131267/m.226869 type:complete len:386 (+) Transcript_131267:30-1187(+)